MNDLRPVPTLDALAADPTGTAELPLEMVEILLARALVVQAALYGRLLAARVNGRPAPTPSEDRLLAVEEAAARLAVSKDWLYRHASALPFTVRNGRRQVRFSGRGIERYIRERQRA